MSKVGSELSLLAQACAIDVQTTICGLKIAGSSRLAARTNASVCIPEFFELIGEPHSEQKPRETMLPLSARESQYLIGPVSLNVSADIARCEACPVPLSR